MSRNANWPDRLTIGGTRGSVEFAVIPVSVANDMLALCNLILSNEDDIPRYIFSATNELHAHLDPLQAEEFTLIDWVNEAQGNGEPVDKMVDD